MQEKEPVSINSCVPDPEDDASDLTAIDLSKGWFERGGKHISEEEGKAALREVLEKQTAILLDADIAAHFRESAGSEEIETVVNKFLRERLNLEAMLRRVVREELRERSKEAS
ncbi:MAG: hypothetical protein AB7W37_06350 [Syntrophobacteraceae bacterium]